MIRRRSPIRRRSKPIKRSGRGKTRPKGSLKSLRTQLDLLFSRYVKERDQNPDGSWTCCTCGRIVT